MFDLHEVGFQLCNFSNSEETETYSAKYIHTMQVVFLSHYLKKARQYNSKKKIAKEDLYSFTQKTKDRTTRTPIKMFGELECPGKVFRS